MIFLSHHSNRLYHAIISIYDRVRFRLAHLTPAISHLDFSTSTGTDCDVYTTNNAGCGVQLADSTSFGPNFNNIGGGWSIFYSLDRQR